MSGTIIELTEDDFDDQYPLVPNHINPRASWAFGNGCGCLFETYGNEFEYVRRFDPRKVWTLIDGDDGNLYVVSGLHYVNRIGYLLSRNPLPPGLTVEVHIPMESDEEEA